jgi:hypothetical protein
MLSAIGILAALAGCKTCWIDRDDERPMKYGSARDCLDYGWWGECFHPKYHCGPPDGIRDHLSVKKAAVKAANRALSEQNCGATSRDFRYGFQQAYMDVANGGNGTLPAVPPARYWAAPYRTTWGHNKAREWFSGYEAGASAAKCCMPADTISVPTSVYRDSDHRLAVGLDGGSSGAAPIVSANFGGFAGGAMPQASPMVGSPYPTMPYSSGRYWMSPSGAMPVPAMNQPVPFNGSPLGGSAGINAAPPMMPPPAINAPYSDGPPGGGWLSGPSPTWSPPNYPAPYGSGPTYSVPPSPSVVPNFAPSPVPSIPTPGSTDGGGYSIPVPNGVVNPPVTPMDGQRLQLPSAPQRAISPSDPWGPFRGLNGFGFKPEGASR